MKNEMVIAEDRDEFGNVTRRLTTKSQKFRSYCLRCGVPLTGWYSDPFALARKGKLKFFCDAHKATRKG